VLNVLKVTALLKDADVVMSNEVTRWVCGSPTGVRVGINFPLKSINDENIRESWYTKLEAHKVEHGDCLVARHHGLPLYSWVIIQRMYV
jgi:hypothetical protein